jgi:hypothetical protein
VFPSSEQQYEKVRASADEVKQARAKAFANVQEVIRELEPSSLL